MEKILAADTAGVIMLLGAIPAIPIVWYIWDDRNKPGVRWFVLGMGSGAGWSLTAGLAVLVDGRAATLAFSHANNFVAALAAVCWVLLAIEYTFKQTLSWNVFGALLVVPLAGQAVLWSSPGANAIFAAGTTVDAAGVLQIERGPGYFVTTGYNYLLALTAVGIWSGEWLTVDGKRRRQTGILLAATALLLIAVTLSLVNAVPPLDPTPVAFVLSGGIFAYALTEYQFLQLTPAGREEILGTVPDAVVMSDSTGCIVDANAAAAELFGFEGEIVGCPVDDAFAQYPQVRSHLGDGTSEKSELELTVDGEPRHFDPTVSTIEFGRGAEGTVLVLRDVTSLKRREAELERSRDLLDGTQKLADVGGWELAVDTNQLRWTDGVGEIFESLSESHHDATTHLETFYHPEDSEEVRDAVQTAITDGEPFELEVRSDPEHSGDERWVRLYGAPGDDAEHVNHVRGALQDITEQKRREQDLDLLRQVLSRVFRHNIRNDLTVVEGYARRIQELGDDEVVSLASDIIDESRGIVRQGEKAREIEDIVDSGHTATEVDLERAVERGVEPYREEFPDATIETSVPAGLSAAAHRNIDKAIQNLVENAIVHAEEDEQPTVEVTAEQSGETVGIVVTDDGPGIPQSEIDVLEAKEETDLHHGSGVGLWLVKWIVEESGGSLDIETTGRGTRVTMQFHGTNQTVSDDEAETTT